MVALCAGLEELHSTSDDKIGPNKEEILHLSYNYVKIIHDYTKK